MVEFFDDIEDGLSRVISEADLSPQPKPVEQNSAIKEWFEKEWPEAIEKFGSYVSKQALADMIVPSGIVAAFGVAGMTIGTLFGFTPAVGFGGGAFLGMFATRQVTTKDVANKVDESLGSDSESEKEN